MKNIILALSLLMLSAPGFGAGNGIERMEIDFSSAKGLSEDAQKKVESILNIRCHTQVLKSHPIKVYVAEKKTETPDFGIEDYTYDMAITFNDKAKDVVLMTLKEWEVANPRVDKFDVLKFMSNGGCE